MHLVAFERVSTTRRFEVDVEAADAINARMCQLSIFAVILERRDAATLALMGGQRERDNEQVEYAKNQRLRASRRFRTPRRRPRWRVVSRHYETNDARC